MQEKIADKPRLALGPSSIYDELYEDGGGVIERSAHEEPQALDTGTEVI